MIGLIGRKIGMTQIFTEDGSRVPVTVIQAGPCTVTGIRTQERDGYSALQLGFGEIKKNSKKKTRLNKAAEGAFKKVKVTPARHIREFRTEDAAEKEIGQQIDLSIFEGDKYLDVTGISIGKGFQGVIRRYGMRGGPSGHGSNFHRRPGAVGNCSDPSRIFKGKKMPGRMGGQRTTMKNLKLVELDKENNILLLKGNVPGNNNEIVYIKKSLTTKK